MTTSTVLLRRFILLWSCLVFATNAIAINQHDNDSEFQRNNLASNLNVASETKERLRKLHTYAEDAVENEEAGELALHSDNGPAWPIPGNESYAKTAEMLKKFEALGNRADFPRIIQPISFINLIKADGTGRNPYSSFVKQVEQLNRAYSGEDARAAGYAKATDTNIRFKLAGVRYVVNDLYFDLCALPSYIQVIRPKYMMNGATHLNVYVCWSAANLGLAWLPYDSWFRQNTGEGHFALGAIVHWELLPGNNFKNGMWSKGNILTHEIGHCYGLRHPYEGDCMMDEAFSDQIGDTPRMSGNPLANCAAVKNRDSCPNHAGKDDMSNYMVATADSCRNHFTPGQVEYMQKVIQTYKPTLMSQRLPGCVAAVDSTDYSPDLQPCLAGTVKVDVNGKQWCKTDPDNDKVWGWACCPQSLDFDNEECRQGSPKFDLPPNVVETPRTSGRPGDNGATLTKTPTPAPTKKPTLAPTKKPTRAPTLKPTKKSQAVKATGAPTKTPTKTPTKKPTKKKARKRKAKRRGLLAVPSPL